MVIPSEMFDSNEKYIAPFRRASVSNPHGVLLALPCILLSSILSSLSLTPWLQKLYDLGGEVADSTQKCTHLVANKVTRTVKFLTAVSVVKHIVTPQWLEESWKSQKFVGESVWSLICVSIDYF